MDLYPLSPNLCVMSFIVWNHRYIHHLFLPLLNPRPPWHLHQPHSWKRSQKIHRLRNLNLRSLDLVFVCPMALSTAANEELVFWHVRVVFIEQLDWLKENMRNFDDSCVLPAWVHQPERRQSDLRSHGRPSRSWSLYSPEVRGMLLCIWASFLHLPNAKMVAEFRKIAPACHLLRSLV